MSSKNGNALPFGTTVDVATDAEGSNFKLSALPVKIGSGTEPESIGIGVSSTEADNSVVKTAELSVTIVVPVSGGDGEITTTYTSLFSYWGPE